MLLACLSSVCIFVECKQEKKRIVTAEEIRRYEERNIEVNREIVKRKQDTIKQYIHDNCLKMDSSGSGLWYNITPSGDTTPIKTGDLVKIAYNISLLNGKQCYSSDSLGLKEAILLMHKGDTADLLIPPHLAHGLIGDQNQIPVLAILHYNVIVKEHFGKK